VAFATCSLTADGAFAAVNYNSSKSNSGNFALDPKDPNAAKACTDAGGKVSTQKNGHKVCSINYNASKSNTGN
jgi:hypothetical protein